MVAYEVLLEKILSGELLPGSIIQERRLTEEIGVSRTPVRDALLMLENEGLLVRREPRMLQVKHMDTREYFDNLHIRQILEPEAASLAAQRVATAEVEALEARIEALAASDEPERAEIRATDERLHEMIGLNSGNPQLWRIVQGLRLQTLVFDVKSLPERRQATFAEHLTILGALKARNSDAARDAMFSHLENVRKSIIDHLTGGGASGR
ncbi:GntR family transcriptional regulator [Tropicimonas isoalkanivorans]|nr:GntR family transcriptional regulator [Tropicimonas isoalkanivorans]